MGWAARANPRSFMGNDPTGAYEARLERFFEAFATRTDYEYFLNRAKVTPAEWAMLEARLPQRLTVGGTV